MLFVLFFVSGVANGTETGSTYYILSASLDICVNIISILNCAPRIPLTKALFFVII